MDKGDGSFFAEYNRIAQKLKKGFMKRLNPAEAASDFRRLVVALQRQGNGQYAAFCCLAVARCEQALKNQTGEAAAYVDAGQLLWQDEEETMNMGVSGYEGSSTEATQVYSLAIQVYLGQKRYAQAAMLYHEMGGHLQRLGKPHKAAQCLTKAAYYLAKTVPPGAPPAPPSVAALQQRVAAFLEHGEEEQALETLRSIVTAASYKTTPGTKDLDVHACAVVDSYVSQALLLARLGKLGDAMAACDALARLPEMTALTESLPDLMTSFVTALGERSGQRETLRLLAAELWPLLTALQNTVVADICSRVGE